VIGAIAQAPLRINPLAHANLFCRSWLDCSQPTRLDLAGRVVGRRPCELHRHFGQQVGCPWAATSAQLRAPRSPPLPANSDSKPDFKKYRPLLGADPADARCCWKQKQSLPLEQPLLMPQPESSGTTPALADRRTGEGPRPGQGVAERGWGVTVAVVSASASVLRRHPDLRPGGGRPGGTSEPWPRGCAMATSGSGSRLVG